MIKHYIIISFLWVSNLIFSQVDVSVLHQTIFPEQWDADRNLRGQNGEVLIWTREYNKQFESERRSCILLETETNLTGEKVYSISEKTSDERPYNKWYTMTIHRHPGKDLEKDEKPENYRISRAMKFTESPTKAQLLQVMQIGGYYFDQGKEQWECLEAGIHAQLWEKMYGSPPDKEDFIRFLKTKKL